MPTQEAVQAVFDLGDRHTATLGRAQPRVEPSSTGQLELGVLAGAGAGAGAGVGAELEESFDDESALELVVDDDSDPDVDEPESDDDFPLVDDFSRESLR